jgi:hypothetical protein
MTSIFGPMMELQTRSKSKMHPIVERARSSLPLFPELASERSFQKSDFWVRKSVLPASAPRPKSQTALRQEVATPLLEASAVQNSEMIPAAKNEK